MRLQQVLCVLIPVCIAVADGFIFGRSSANSDCPPVRCFMNPCRNAKCPAKPSARCQQHKCQCTATFWDGLTEVTEQCQVSTAPSSGGDVALSTSGDSNTCLPVRCFMNPCINAKCPAKPSARCQQHKCECSATFWDGLTEVTEQCQVSAAPSSGGDVAFSKKAADSNCPPVRCFRNPCDNAKCPAKPSASCRRHNCQCTATFWEGFTEVTDQCAQISVSKMAPRTLPGASQMNSGNCGNLPTVNCHISPCDLETCAAHPNAQCINNYCGTCSAQFKVGSKDVTSECAGNDLAMNKGSDLDIIQRKVPVIPKPEKQPCLSSCFFTPCRLAYCASYPNARCVNDNCQGCIARFYVGNQEVTSMCKDRVPALPKLFSGSRRRLRSFFSPWMAFLDNLF